MADAKIYDIHMMATITHQWEPRVLKCSEELTSVFNRCRDARKGQNLSLWMSAQCSISMSSYFVSLGRYMQATGLLDNIFGLYVVVPQLLFLTQTEDLLLGCCPG